MKSHMEKHLGGQEAVGMRESMAEPLLLKWGGGGGCVEVSLVREQNTNVGVCG